MISFIRSIISSRFGAFFALLFIGLIGVAFALGDVTGSSSFGGLGGGNVAKVGKQNITLGEFGDALQNRLRAERKDNPTLDMAKFVEAGGYDATLSQLINRYGLAEFAEANGMAVSKRLVDYEIRKMPQTKGIDGKFSAEEMRRFLSNIGMTEKSFRADLNQNFYAQQILPAIQSKAKSPKSLSLPYASLLLEKRKGQVALIPSQAFFPKEEPTEKILQEFYADNETRYSIPERRSVQYVIFSRSIVDEKAKPSDKDIAEYYEANADEFAASSTRNLAQIITKSEEDAKKIVANTAGGEPLSVAAKSLGYSVTEIEDVTESTLTNSASSDVAKSVFAAKNGAIATPTKGKLGWYVVKVQKTNEIAAKSLAQATPQIKKLLSVEKKEEAIIELTSEIEDAFSDGQNINDVAKANGLTVEKTPLLLANGQNPKNQNYKPAPEVMPILSAGFQMDVDGDAQLIEIIPNEKFAMVAVDKVEEAAPPPFAELKPLVQQHWAMEKGSAKAKDAAEKIRKSVASGKSMTAAIAELKVRLPAPQTIAGTRGQLRQQGQQLPPPLLLMFSMKNGTSKKLAAPNNAGWFVVNLTEVTKGDASNDKKLVETMTTEMSALTEQELAAQFINAALKNVGLKRNEEALAARRKQYLNADGSN